MGFSYSKKADNDALKIVVKIRNKNKMELTKKELHKIEMELVNLCEDEIEQTEFHNKIKEAIINKFTDLMSKIKE